MSKKKLKMKNSSTLVLFLIFVILLVIYIFIPKQREVITTISIDEYKNQIYDEVYQKVKPDDDIENEIPEEYNNIDELYKVQTQN